MFWIIVELLISAFFMISAWAMTIHYIEEHGYHWFKVPLMFAASIFLTLAFVFQALIATSEALSGGKD